METDRCNKRADDIVPIMLKICNTMNAFQKLFFKICQPTKITIQSSSHLEIRE